MPSVVGAVNVTSNAGEMNVGDVLKISPKTTTKTFATQGTNNLGVNVNELNEVSIINTWNIVGTNQPIAGNV